MIDKDIRLKIALFGVSFSNSNLGVRSLGRGILTLLLKKYPNAEIFCFSSNSDEPKDIVVDRINIPIHPAFLNTGLNFILRNNVFNLYFKSLLYKWLKVKLFGDDSILGVLSGCDLALDATGGDSFSDIYGMKRFTAACLQKIIICNMKKRLVLPPQTYGPFESAFSRMLAKKAISGAGSIFTRDKLSLDCLKNELGIKKEIKLFPDVGFAIHEKPYDWKEVKDFIGINISGLVYKGGYSGKNDYGLSCDYPGLMEKVLHFFLEEKNQKVVLIPHVFDSQGIDNDVSAIRSILKRWDNSNLSMVEPDFDEQEFRSVIKSAQLFIGSRMHACISSCCQLVPTICLAYSRKFAGVMETIGYDKFVLDMQRSSTDELFSSIKEMYHKKEEMARILKEEIPKAIKRLDNLFDEIKLQSDDKVYTDA